MARFAVALLLLLSARALADEGCADGACQADDAEVSALLQRSAAEKARVTQHSHANTTETTTLTCYESFAGTYCGAAMSCYKDTQGCSTSGAGVCCKAAGNGAGLEQCKFCGDATCGPCPGQPRPTPAPTPPTPAPTPRPSGNQVGEKCGQSGSTGYYYGSCMNGLVCAPPANAQIGTSNVCANICGSFGESGDRVTGPCNRMQSCSCKAQLPCSPWQQGAAGCYMYCC